jgi:hypothetical protein
VMMVWHQELCLTITECAMYVIESFICFFLYVRLDLPAYF